MAAWEEEKMVLEAIYGAEACPTPIAIPGPNTVAVEIPLPEGSLLSAIISAATAGGDNDGDGDKEASVPSSSTCRLEFACPHGRPEGCLLHVATGLLFAADDPEARKNSDGISLNGTANAPRPGLFGV
jgi:hypothetical protein